jgi:glycine cleavage system H protein
MSVPTDLHYTAEHEWVSLDGDIATVGVTDYATRALGDISSSACLASERN